MVKSTKTSKQYERETAYGFNMTHVCVGVGRYMHRHHRRALARARSVVGERSEPLSIDGDGPKEYIGDMSGRLEQWGSNKGCENIQWGWDGSVKGNGTNKCGKCQIRLSIPV